MGWQDEFKLRDDLLQEDVYAFAKAVQEAGGRIGAPSVDAEHLLKAAITAKWIAAPETETGKFEGETRFFIGGTDVRKLHGGKVLWYGGEIATRYREAIEIPPNS